MATSDPVQMLIDAGAIPQNPFDEHSRYRKVAIALLAAPPASLSGGAAQPAVPYLRRRFIAQPGDIALAAYATVAASWASRWPTGAWPTPTAWPTRMR
jgi:hypothetical protein